MIKEVCTKCHNTHYTWSSADDDRWENHEMVMCPPQLMKPEDNRLMRTTQGDMPSWCPYRKDHSPRRHRNQKAGEGEEPRDDMGPF